MERPIVEESAPCFVIGVVSRMIGVHPQTLRHYERMGLVRPSRSMGNIRLYSQRDVGRLRQIKSLVEDLGVSLTGVEVILGMQAEIDALTSEVQELREAARRAVV